MWSQIIKGSQIIKSISHMMGQGDRDRWKSVSHRRMLDKTLKAQ